MHELIVESNSDHHARDEDLVFLELLHLRVKALDLLEELGRISVVVIESHHVLLALATSCLVSILLSGEPVLDS